MAPESQVADKRTIVRNPTSDDPNAGIIVAAGDPIPAGVGVISNTPNKVDAAANMEVADAADQAKNPTPATRVVAGSQLNPEAAAAQAEIVERVRENTQVWGEQQRATFDGEPVDADTAGVSLEPGADNTPPAENDGSTGDTTGTAPADMTVAELDAAYGDSEGYPKAGNKADKVAFATAQDGS